MADYRVLITDLTDYGTLRCVAGWDIDRNVMIRPEPAPAAFWPEDQSGPDKVFYPGQVVGFNAVQPEPATDYPHFSEDVVVRGDVKLIRKLVAEDYKKILRKIAVPPTTIFADHVVFQNEKIRNKASSHCSSSGIQMLSTPMMSVFARDDSRGVKKSIAGASAAITLFQLRNPPIKPVTF